jgi:uncharacterized protein DUF6876
MSDRMLKALGQFCGTENYYKVIGFNVTDGIHYIMENGYSYLLTDCLAVIAFKPRLRHADFLVIRFTADPERHEGRFEIREDSDRPILYQQSYGYTDAQVKEIILFYESGVLLLAGEH